MIVFYPYDAFCDYMLVLMSYTLLLATKLLIVTHLHETFYIVFLYFN